MHDWAAPNDLELINEKVYFFQNYAVEVAYSAFWPLTGKAVLITDKFSSNHSNSGFYFQFELKYGVAHFKVDSIGNKEDTSTRK